MTDTNTILGQNSWSREKCEKKGPGLLSCMKCSQRGGDSTAAKRHHSRVFSTTGKKICAKELLMGPLSSRNASRN